MLAQFLFHFEGSGSGQEVSSTCRFYLHLSSETSTVHQLLKVAWPKVFLGWGQLCQLHRWQCSRACVCSTGNRCSAHGWAKSDWRRFWQGSSKSQSAHWSNQSSCRFLSLSCHAVSKALSDQHSGPACPSSAAKLTTGSCLRKGLPSTQSDNLQVVSFIITVLLKFRHMHKAP